MAIDGKNKDFYWLQVFWTPERLLFSSICFFFSERAVDSRFKKLSLGIFLCFAGFSWADILRFRRETGEIVLEKIGGNKCGFRGNWLEHFEGSKILYVHRPKALNALIVQPHEILIQEILCLYNNAINLLYAATNQSKNKREVQNLRISTSQRNLTWDPTVRSAYWLALHHREIENNKVRTLKFNN